MGTNETTSVQVINLGNRTVWRYYDYDRDEFKRFLAVPSDKNYKILLQGEMFLVIGNYMEAFVFIWQKGELKKVPGIYKLFSFISTTNSDICLYRADCKQASFCLLFWRGECFFVKTLESCGEGDWQAVLADGRQVRISEEKVPDDDPDYSHCWYTVDINFRVDEAKENFPNLAFAELNYHE